MPNLPEKTFIETQFPVSKLSKESYKERKANLGQTLTGLGKWWGRKPLILIRAALLGLLLPATENPRKDRDIFLKLLTMDEEGLWLRKSKNIPLREVYNRLSEREREKWFQKDTSPDKPKIKKHDELKIAEIRQILQQLVFERLSYDEKLEYCDRPEHIPGPSPQSWDEINKSLGTNASSLPELVQQLGERRFGHIPRVGDAFCGGGSVPFEAARLGCEVYGTDLNPVAALLTWGALHIVGGGTETGKKVHKAQKEVYEAVDRQITTWGIEHNAQGWRADAYLYCTETRCPECDVIVPLAPSWVIGERTKTIARLEINEIEGRFDIHIESDVSEARMEEAKAAGTAKDNYLHCPNPFCKKATPMAMIRGDRKGDGDTRYGLRLWENYDLVPRPDDIFQERLYCIRWVETLYDDEGKPYQQRYYREPDDDDLQREKKVLNLLHARFKEWQEKGFIPDKKIEPGEKTDEPIRTRGWTHWHHLFNPRQLLIHGLYIIKFNELNFNNPSLKAALMLGIGRLADWDSKLCRWDASAANEKVAQTFSNQALNTLFTYAIKTFMTQSTSWFLTVRPSKIFAKALVAAKDARQINLNCDVFITDPPYADAINYHELSEFFLAWYEKPLLELFPYWYSDSKRALAITGMDEGFRRSMVDSYRNLTAHMPDNGLQLVMFTHQNAAVWADLALILWAAGLRVTAAWTIGTETESALKGEGNYVQGTVFLVLRKRLTQDSAFLDELYPEIETEVKAQLDAMLHLDDQEDPNFGDTDYQLAAYAAALRVLTQYSTIEDLDIDYELSRAKQKGETSAIENLIAEAVKIACDHLIPQGFETSIWKTLTPDERFYLKGLELEKHGEGRVGAYQELARGFGVKDYNLFLASAKANQTRCKNATDFAAKNLGGEGFGNSLVRQALFAVREAGRSGDILQGRNWLRTEVPDYWSQRKSLLAILRYLAALKDKTDSWKSDGELAYLLAGAVENDHI